MLVLIGESGSGKTTIEDTLIKRFNYVRAISCTTRKPREKDIDGVNYFFISKEEYNEKLKNGTMVENIEFNGNYYGLYAEQCKNDRVVVLAPEGLRQVLEKDLNILSIYIKVKEETRAMRMLSRGDSFDDVKGRIEYDRKIFKDIEGFVDFTVENDEDDIDEITNKVLKIYLNNINSKEN